MKLFQTKGESAEHGVESRIDQEPDGGTKESPLPKGEGQGEGKPHLMPERRVISAKSRQSNSQSFNRFLTLAALAALLLLCTFRLARGDSTASNYTVHEWGTFTSVQGGDGQLLLWRPSKTAELPGFVYDWNNAGLNRRKLVALKTSVMTLQRMETPVMYFYADQPMNVNVNVAFPLGEITEWYPQASQIGPSSPVDTDGPTKNILNESRAIWNLQITPPSAEDEKNLPRDASGSHYFAAREPRSDSVHTDPILSTNNTSETEKFIFYRGVGRFTTPLHVTVDSNNLVTVENTGSNNLAHLFLINIHDGFGYLDVMDELPASNSVPWQQLTTDSTDHWNRYPLPEFQNEIANQMQTALTSEGLFPDEAKAMVDTWKDSWFTEEGVRILYILPRTWTDDTLPLTLTPQPTELTRVMVGRAEIITPDAVNSLAQALTKAANGDADATAQARKQLKTFGRFAPPALQLVSAKNPNQNVNGFGYQLLYPQSETATK